MGRMQGTGISASALPYKRKAPLWSTMTPKSIVLMIVKYAKKGMTPSQIGVALRDQYGIPQVRFITGKKILRILKKEGKPFPPLGPHAPEKRVNDL